MKKIFYGIAAALIMISIILVCTNPSMQDFIEYIKKSEGSNKAATKPVLRENYFIFSTYSRSGGEFIQEKIWEGYSEKYVGIFGRFYLHSTIIIN